ncbi:MAG: hypothetical protein KDB60_17595, partial [Propionibacteriaceae bacterium]|nr:hypothetical protein [Propionibacteriaceae bacterium]
MTSMRPPSRGALRRLVAVLSAGVLGLALAGCQSGPQSVPDGTYRLFADASTTSPGAADGLTIASGTVTLTADGATSTAELGAASSEYLLCPPSGKGTARTLGSALTINGT